MSIESINMQPPKPSTSREAISKEEKEKIAERQSAREIGVLTSRAFTEASPLILATKAADEGMVKKLVEGDYREEDLENSIKKIAEKSEDKEAEERQIDDLGRIYSRILIAIKPELENFFQDRGAIDFQIIQREAGMDFHGTGPDLFNNKYLDFIQNFASKFIANANEKEKERMKKQLIEISGNHLVEYISKYYRKNFDNLIALSTYAKVLKNKFYGKNQLDKKVAGAFNSAWNNNEHYMFKNESTLELLKNLAEKSGLFDEQDLQNQKEWQEVDLKLILEIKKARETALNENKELFKDRTDFQDYK